MSLEPRRHRRRNKARRSVSLPNRKNDRLGDPTSLRGVNGSFPEHHLRAAKALGLVWQKPASV